MRKGQEQLRVLMGGRGGPTPPGRSDGPRLTRGTLGLVLPVRSPQGNSIPAADNFPNQP